MAKRRLFIEAGSIAEKNMSGVGHTALSIVKALAGNEKFSSQYMIVLLVPFNKVALVRAHDLPEIVAIRRVFLPGRVMNGLVRFNKLPYMDLFFGKGLYLFPNFKNWPLIWSKSLTYIHDVYFKIKPEHIETKNLDLLEKHTEKFIARTDVVITVSDHAKREIETYFLNAKGKVAVVYNGIDHSLYYPRKKTEQHKVARRYGLVENRYFIFFSNIEPRKNVETLLEAYKLFVDETNERDIALLLVGGMGWANEDILKKMKTLQDEGYAIIKPAAYVPDEDMPALLSGSIALVHPALYEGFGLTPLEAMACGRPVIVGNNSSLPEVMGPNYTKYVDITNENEIKQAMIRYLNDSKEDEYGIARAAEFSWEKSARMLQRVIDKEAGESSE